MNLIVIGPVAAGKSTIIGHMVWKFDGIDKRTMKQYEKGVAQ